MDRLLHQLVEQHAASPQAALEHKNNTLSYQALAEAIEKIAGGLQQLGARPGDRIAIYLPKQFEAVISLFAASRAGMVFVPINPLLKPAQVKHILQDCSAHSLITSESRAQQLGEVIQTCNELKNIVITDSRATSSELPDTQSHMSWQALLEAAATPATNSSTADQLAAILYTSGSTGQPKGVMLSHRNLVVGALSVAQYLNNSRQDRILALLPLSFDYGLSQLTTAFATGATAVLMDYLLPREIIKTIANKQITGLAAVPPIWNQIASLPWPAEAQQSLRYLTNSGGALSLSTIAALRKNLPSSALYLMYGLTEAFRSSYLPPELLDSHPTSIGKAIPNTELWVLREDGSPCQDDEPGELVHRGPLVGMGYWNSPQATAERFRPLPPCLGEGDENERVVWSGDTVMRDRDGFLYFIERRDEMIKTSGYRVSPSEVESVIQNSGLVTQVAALGIPHPMLGKAIVVVASADGEQRELEQRLLTLCQQQLANFMVPQKIFIQQSLPTNPNGKIDRKQLAQQHQALFQD